jgi:hypothetical protein
MRKMDKVWRKWEMKGDRTVQLKTPPQYRMGLIDRGFLKGRSCEGCNREECCQVRMDKGEMGECFAPDGTILILDERPV